MQKRCITLRLGIPLLALALAGCPESPTDNPAEIEGENTETITITNIPGTTARTGNTGAASFKIYVQLSSGADQSAGYVAKGEAKIGDQNSVNMDLKGPDGKTWTGKGTFNMAVTISPAAANSHEDILVRASQDTVFNTRAPSFAWNGNILLDLWFLKDNVQGMEQNIKDLYSGIVAEDLEVSTPVATKITITNIPATTARTGKTGAASFKIYVQLSSGADQSAGFVAQGQAKIDGKTSVSMDLKDTTGTSWAKQGAFNMAVTISPATTSSYEDILVKASQSTAFNTKKPSFAWDSLLDLWAMNRTDDIQGIYNGVIKSDTEITTSTP
ncbi:MAG: hypothetical protein LBD37_09210 [Treponema sp.]|nr:hypothetical protein [Treponema sp.]